MSDWADIFPSCTPLQLKHQLAMWKSKAISLEFENQVLRETLREMYIDYPTNQNTSNEADSSGSVDDTSEESMDCESDSDSESEAAAAGDSEGELKMGGKYVEVKENFKIVEARAERKQTEQAEREREAIMPVEQALMNPALMNPHPNEEHENRTKEYKTLYGDDWQRVAALENHIESEYMSLCDREKPSYWPNIPLKMKS